MLKKFEDELEYYEPYKLKVNFHNYKLITINDFILKKKRKELSPKKYKEYERLRLKEFYNTNYDYYFNYFYNQTYKDKF